MLFDDPVDHVALVDDARVSRFEMVAKLEVIHLPLEGLGIH